MSIAQIHGIEKSDDTQALVLELVEGPTLADRIAKGPIPLDEALPIAKHIAEALEAAHEQRFLHRDLKPANVKVKADGTVKVLDFGLAKAFQPEASGAVASESPTILVDGGRDSRRGAWAGLLAPPHARIGSRFGQFRHKGRMAADRSDGDTAGERHVRDEKHASRRDA